MNHIKTFGHTLIISVKTLLLIFLTISTFNANAQLDNQGKDFVMAFLPQLGSPPIIELHLTGDVATDVTVVYPMNTPTFIQTVSIIPGTVTILSLPTQAATSWTVNAVTSNLIRATADEEFVVYQVNRASATSDAGLALPVDTMNVEYLVSDYNALFSGLFTVYAAFDNTEVTITPTNNMSGHLAGVPFVINLNRGEGYHGQSLTSGTAGSLTGTRVVADRPVGLINGNTCTNIPLGTGACDHVFEIAQPLVSWGLTASAAGLPNRLGGTIYRILASENNTSMTINGVPTTVINAGEFFETAAITGNQFFAADKPIFVTQFMTGQNAPGATSGDPAMTNIIPSEQYQNNYTFSTVGAAQFAENFLTIIADNTDVGFLTLDGVPVPAGDYSPIPGGTLSAAVLALSQGTHNTASVNPHGVTVEGYNNFDSYIYPGGALFQFINQIGDAFLPVCSLDINNNAGTGSVTDNKPTEDVNGNGILDPGEDSNGNNVIDNDTGVFFVEMINGVNAISSIDPFIPGDGQVNFTIDLIDPGQSGSATITGTDGAGNTCSVNFEVTIGGPLICDTDADGDIDRLDLRAISIARGQVALPNDPRDANLDGMITPSDTKVCIPLCTLARCAINSIP
ncbi:IgGFc-binding protein [Colwellia sp. MB02u-18]|uniref:IgGFc-binding protein n=1 Tax=unclassified Colwellia TaxID=196834 RepID=UPI0015F49DBD|nr:MULTISPECIES: IgGFc-binding protein [unclassified Colwellia]MBA6224109.1 IgGFc-binding protein [Colwellia sp. MB3u-45]MBA6268999.1 IgGFc-binding protein [Colwellia sp. MB3u-43]MBA6320915.1 IgGFc-binding protein [Colwellia sp. MB02u-19]MBA6324195.1 IgGFc-binding protein [Colwellia sp. MB02u-18]MBA6332744.1 IgGFc-binding protein [Colwellia sp. MB02u-12]